MKIFKTSTLVLIGLCVLVTPSSAGVPRLINYQGFLTDASAVPIDGPHNLTFKIYPDSSQSAQALWTEQHSSVDIDDGLFNVLLGGTAGIPDSLLDGDERWMGITVDTDPEMFPRMRLTSVPWALRAAVADSALAVPSGTADGHSLDAADGDPVNVIYVDNNGSVGVGTLSPGSKLEINGTVTTSGFKMPTGATAGYVLVSDGSGVGTWQQVGSGGGGDITAVYALDGLWSPDSGESGDIHLYVLTQPGSGLTVDPVDGVKIEPQGVTEDMLAANAVTAAKLDSAAVTSAKLASEAVGSSALAAAAVTGDKLAALAVADSNLRASSVTSDKLLNGAVNRDKLFNGAVNTAKLDTNAVTSGKILDNTILFDDIAQNGASEGQVMKWVGGEWVARNDSLGSSGTITGVWGGTGLAGGGSSGSVTLNADFGGNGADTTVSRSDHNHDAAYVNEGQGSSITTDMIIDKAVITAKLDTNAVTTEKILTGTILFDDIGQNGAADGQVIKWSGASSAWIVANDSVGSGGSGSGGWADDGNVVRLETTADSVGIGTNTPTEKLDVDGNIRASGKATIGSANTNSGNSAFVAGENNIVSGNYATIGGGTFNRARGEFSVIAGGGGMSLSDSNLAVGDYCVIGGGSGNLAGVQSGTPEDGDYVTISGGSQNRALDEGATVGGGGENVAGRSGGIPYEGKYATVGGGRRNHARGKYSVVCGGGGEEDTEANKAHGEYTVVGGGSRNVAGDTLAPPSESIYATVNGGGRNSAYSRGTTVAGGSDNIAGRLFGGPPYQGQYATVGGGRGNKAEGKYSVVCGGGGDTWPWANRAFSEFSAVGGGSRNVAGDTLLSPDEDVYATVGGGYNNRAHGVAATIGGGAENVVGEPGGSPDDYGDYATIGGGRYNQARGRYAVVGGGGSETGPWANRANGDYCVVGGGQHNEAGMVGPPESVTHATVSGGQDNRAEKQFSAVGGGNQNEAQGIASFVGGGNQNIAYATNSVIAGGDQNTASGPASAVCGGADNYATGQYATVPGGWMNAAQGAYSFAAGNQAKALHDGSVVISATDAGTPDDSVWTNGNGEMVLRADNGFYLTNQGEQAAVQGLLGTSTGAWLSGAGQWRDASSRELKENFTDVDKGELLEKLAAVPVTRWNYKVDNDDIKHVGPVAQDFYAAFGVGDDDVSLSALDVAGISLAAIQELSKRNQSQQTEIEALKTQVKELKDLIRSILAEQQKESAGGNAR